MHPPLPLVYFQLNPDSMSFDLEPSFFEPYMATDPTGRATCYTCAEPGQVRRQLNHSVKIRVSC